MKQQCKSPAALKRGLPKTQPERDREYRRRYGIWWRKQNAGYMARYHKQYRADGRDNGYARHLINLTAFATQASAA